MKRWIPSAVLVVAIAAMLAHGPIAQLDHYHEFADTRAFFGIANAFDVLSNLGFLAVGLWGMVALRTARGDRATQRSRPAYFAFLVAITLTAFGSGYYHLAPDNDRLVFDRLPIAMACASLLAAVHAEIHERPWPWMLPALLVAGVASVLWWSFTEASGTGDLRPYLLIQVAPLVIIPLWQWIHRAPRADRIAFAIAIALYALAKAFELADRAVFDTTGFVSGHTIKHVLAFAAAAVLVGNLVRRRRSESSPRAG